MKKLKKYISSSVKIIFVIFISSCGTEKDKNTSIFSEYLAKKFNAQIPISSHYYILVPKLGCQGAMFNTLAAIDAASFKQLNNITVITSNKPIVSECLHRNWKILYDDSGDLDILNLSIVNVSLILTNNESITAIKSSRECESDIGAQIVKLLKKNN